MRGRRLLAALFLLLPSTAFPQLRETVEVSIVNVDVFVTDKAGRRVHGLTKDDFEIFENGAKQPITNFAEYTRDQATAPATPIAATGSAPPRQRRTIVVFVERFYLPDFRTDPFFASIRKLLHDALGPGDRAMIVSWNRGVLLAEQPLTDSLPALDRALDGLAKLSAMPVTDLRSDMRWSIQFAQSFDDQASAWGISSNGEGIAEMQADYFAQLEKWSQEKKVLAINGLIRSIAADEGKKVMLLVTHRLSRYAGLETHFLTNRSVDALKLVEKQAFLNMSKELKSIDETANANGVTIYPLFPEGMESTMTDSSEAQALPVTDYQTLVNETSALREIAEETGGLAAWGPDTAKLLPQVTEDLDSYYSLAYRVRSGRNEKERHIVVKTKDPSLVVRSRRGFTDKNDNTRMEDRVIAALFGNPPTTGFPLHVVLGQGRHRGKQFSLPLRIDIPISSLTPLPEGSFYSGAFSVYFAWGGRLGGISDTSHQTKSYRIPAAEIEKARATGHVTYTIELTGDRKTELIAFGVVDENSKEYALRVIDLRR